MLAPTICTNTNYHRYKQKNVLTLALHERYNLDILNGILVSSMPYLVNETSWVKIIKNPAGIVV
jgi:hypothetical protein